MRLALALLTLAILTLIAVRAAAADDRDLHG
jgi:hypothetical protein